MTNQQQDNFHLMTSSDQPMRNCGQGKMENFYVNSNSFVNFLSFTEIVVFVTYKFVTVLLAPVII